MAARYRLIHQNTIARLAIAASAVVCACSVPPQASAAVSPTLVAPTRGAVLPRGVPPTFVLKDRNDGIATLEVSASPRTDAAGVFTDVAWSTGYEGRPGGGDIKVSPERSSPDRFWNTPGTYYWHLSRVDCPVVGPRPHTCSQRAISRTRSFRIASRRAKVLTLEFKRCR